MRQAILALVPGSGRLVCDLRADSLDAFEGVLQALPAELGGARLEARLVRQWPGMDARDGTRDLLAAASARLGRSILGLERGGASDASHMSQHVPLTVDGLGPRGLPAWFAHPDQITVSLGSLANVGLDGFANIDAGTIVGMLAQFTGYLEQFRQSDDFKAVDIPLIGDGLDTIAWIAEDTVTQATVPDRILGRVNATLDVLSHGAAPFGALVAAAIAEAYSVRAAIGVAWVGMLAAILFIVFSPLPRLRDVATVSRDGGKAVEGFA